MYLASTALVTACLEEPSLSPRSSMAKLIMDR